jgi:hypothetical protein
VKPTSHRKLCSSEGRRSTQAAAGGLDLRMFRRQRADKSAAVADGPALIAIAASSAAPLHRAPLHRASPSTSGAVIAGCRQSLIAMAGAVMAGAVMAGAVMAGAVMAVTLSLPAFFAGCRQSLIAIAGAVITGAVNRAAARPGGSHRRHAKTCIENMRPGHSPAQATSRCLSWFPF